MRVISFFPIVCRRYGGSCSCSGSGSPAVGARAPARPSPAPTTPHARAFRPLSIFPVLGHRSQDLMIGPAESLLHDVVHSAALRHLLCGAVAGGVAKTTTAPLDRLKARTPRQIASRSFIVVVVVVAVVAGG